MSFKRAADPLRALSLVALALCVGCQYEGDEAGECIDGADNDRNGLFDCLDPACAGSPDCNGIVYETPDSSGGSGDGGSGDGSGGAGDGGGDDTGGGGDTDPPVEVDPDNPAAHLTSFDLTYTLTWDLDSAWELYKLFDCVQIFSGSGTQSAASGTQVTMAGEWVMTDSDCSPDLDGAIWSPDGGAAYTSFTFNDDLSELDVWLVHENASDTNYTSVSSDNSFYIYDMSAPFEDAGDRSTSHEESEDVYDGAFYLATLTHSVSVSFGVE